MFVFAFLRISGRPSAVRRPLAFHVANDSDWASLGRIRFVPSLFAGVLLGGGGEGGGAGGERGGGGGGAGSGAYRGPKMGPIGALYGKIF